MVFCRIIVVIMPNSIRKITLKMLFSVPFWNIQHFFFTAIQGNTITCLHFQFERCWIWKWYLHSHCSHNTKANSKYNSENDLLCSLLRHSTDFFLWLSKETHSAIKTFNSKKLNLEMVFCRIVAVIMPKPIRKITLKTLFCVPCCDSQQIFFFVAHTLSYQNFQFERSWIWKWYFAESL